jgi:hypothetical protein
MDVPDAPTPVDAVNPAPVPIVPVLPGPFLWWLLLRVSIITPLLLRAIGQTTTSKKESFTFLAQIELLLDGN